MNWTKFREKRMLIASGLLVCLLAGVAVSIRSYRSEKSQEVWLNVFIHGSFGSLLGFLDFSSVLHDQISGTKYRAISRKMRNDDHFYMYQPILQRGLTKITPTFDGTLTGNKMYAAYPLIKAYQIVGQHIEPSYITNVYYTFGWTGLISQNSRRFEAIRLYNQLSDELDRYHKKGIFPKVRIITHSHGGNLCLNLASVHAIVNATQFSPNAQLSKDSDENEALHAMLATIKTLKTKEAVRYLPDQKKWDYVPLNREFFIDELVMYATPIQLETEPFCFSSTFGKVVSLYSGEDVIQRADWVSSKQKLSNQRIKQSTVNGVLRDGKKLYQAKIMFERDLVSGKYFKGCVLHTKEKIGTDEGVEPARETSVLKDFLLGINYSKRMTKDPTHKALWFFLCKNEVLGNPTALGYLPIMVLTPLLLKAIETSGLNDSDLNIKNDERQLFIEYTRHDNQVCRGAVTMPLSIIEKIKQGTKAWGEFDISLDDEFEAMYKHFKG